MAGYAPGTGEAYSAEYWTDIGSCDGPPGSLNVTDYPGYSDLPNVGGCPKKWDASEEYDGGDKVSNDESVVYQCKDDSNSNYLFCPQREPGVTQGWEQAWTQVGVCSGTITPSASPSFDTLEDVNGCPDEWKVQTYEEGDKVSGKAAIGPGGVSKLVYKCKGGPQSGWCGLAGYEPGEGIAWKDAWIVEGHCSGTIVPTASPTIDTDAGPCYADWLASEEYEEGDKVSLTVSTIPLRKVSFECKGWPYTLFCKQYKPETFGADQGWKSLGGCDGTGSPTMAPVFVSLTEIGDGCPSAWSASKTDYEEGDAVSLTVSSTPERTVVYKCKAWPQTGYCNQGSGFKPGTKYGKMAWELVGHCDGTISPTLAPTPYQGNDAAPFLCTYTKEEPSPTVTESCTHGSSTDCTCVNVQSTEPCTCSDAGCSNYGICSTAGGTKTVNTQVCTKPKQVDVTYPINNWSSAITYEAGDYVRIGRQKYKCSQHPYTGYCQQYDPHRGTDPVQSAEGWLEDGLCS